MLDDKSKKKLFILSTLLEALYTKNVHRRGRVPRSTLQESTGKPRDPIGT